MAATIPEQGIVSTHAHTIREAKPQRTAETLRDKPTPTIAPVMVCVVDTGMPKEVAKNKAMEPEVCAQNPPVGRTLVMPIPMVRTMRQPPSKVPNAMANWQEITTQKGT